MATGTTGAISELRVCVDLLARGYEVFRSVSQSCSCDIAVLKDGRLFRIEVTTGYENPHTGTLSYSPHKTENYDVIAVVLPEDIVFKPELP